MVANKKLLVLLVFSFLSPTDFLTNCRPQVEIFLVHQRFFSNVEYNIRFDSHETPTKTDVLNSCSSRNHESIQLSHVIVYDILSLLPNRMVFKGYSLDNSSDRYMQSTESIVKQSFRPKRVEKIKEVPKRAHNF